MAEYEAKWDFHPVGVCGEDRRQPCFKGRPTEECTRPSRGGGSYELEAQLMDMETRAYTERLCAILCQMENTQLGQRDATGCKQWQTCCL